MSSPYPPSRPDSQVESSGMVPNTPSQDTQFLEPPRASYLEQTPESGSDSPRGSVALHSTGNASPLLSQDEKRFSEAFADPAPLNELPSAEPSRKRSLLARPIFWAIALLALAIVVVAVVVPVYFLVVKPHSNLATPPNTPSGAGGGGGSGDPSGNSLTTGGNGSIVTTSDGTTFTYINNFGGFCEFACPSVVSSVLRLCYEFVITSLNLLLFVITLPRLVTTVLLLLGGAVAPTPSDPYSLLHSI